MIRAVEGRGAPAARAIPRRVSTGYSTLDALLPGQGYPPGALTQVVAEEGGGGLSLLLPAMRGVQERGHLAAVVDGEGRLHPPGLLVLGLDLSRLLVVRPGPGGARGADWAVAELARVGLLPLVVGLGIPLDGPTAQRLQGAAEAAGTAVLLVSRPRDVRQGLPLALRLRVVPSPPRREGRQVQIEVERVRSALAGRSVVVALPAAAPPS